MKRKIKAIGIMISEFYKAHEIAISIVVTIISAIIFGVYSYKVAEPQEVTKAEIEYCEEKVEEIINTDLKSISKDTIKEMKKNGYTIDIDVIDKEITIGFKEETKGEIIFSYSKKDLSKKISYETAEDNQLYSVFIGALLGGCFIWSAVLVILICILIKVFFIDCISKINDKYKGTLIKLEIQDSNDSEAEEQNDAEQEE